MCKKDFIWNPATCGCENGKYLASIIDESVITCDEIIKETKTVSTKTVPIETLPTNLNFNEKKKTCKKKFLHFTHLFIDYHSIIDTY